MTAGRGHLGLRGQGSLLCGNGHLHGVPGRPVLFGLLLCSRKQVMRATLPSSQSAGLEIRYLWPKLALACDRPLDLAGHPSKWPEPSLSSFCPHWHSRGSSWRVAGRPAPQRAVGTFGSQSRGGGAGAERDSNVAARFSDVTNHLVFPWGSKLQGGGGAIGLRQLREVHRAVQGQTLLEPRHSDFWGPSIGWDTCQRGASGKSLGSPSFEFLLCEVPIIDLPPQGWLMADEMMKLVQHLSQLRPNRPDHLSGCQEAQS